MMITTRSIIVAVLILLFTVTVAHASGSLSFSGGGYWVDLEIGQTEVPVVASVRFHRPGDPIGVVLSRKHVVVEACDPRRQVLELRFVGSGGTNAVEPFTLSANGERQYFKSVPSESFRNSLGACDLPGLAPSKSFKAEAASRLGLTQEALRNVVPADDERARTYDGSWPA